jgi:hypothetical protein
MALPHATSHAIKQALAMVGRLSHRPDARIATRRFVLREAFPVALEIFDLRAMATGRSRDLVRDWRALAHRALAGRESLPPEEAPAAAAPVRRHRRRGGRGRGRRAP